MQMTRTTLRTDARSVNGIRHVKLSQNLGEFGEPCIANNKLGTGLEGLSRVR